VTGRVAVDVGGQVSVLNGRGKLVFSVNPTEVTILPGGRGLFYELVDLPKPLPKGKLQAIVSVDRFRAAAKSPVSFARVRYQRSTGYTGGCSITGVVSNRFTEPKENLQLRAAAFYKGRLVTGGFTYVDKVFPRRDATFKIDFYDSATCPKRVDRVAVLPNMSEDKIYNP
jgi:hypothetical protein